MLLYPLSSPGTMTLDSLRRGFLMLLMALGLTQGKYLGKQVGDRVLDRERSG